MTVAKKTRTIYLRVEVTADDDTDPMSENLSDVALWAEVGLHSKSVKTDVTVYTELNALVADEANGANSPVKQK